MQATPLRDTEFLSDTRHRGPRSSNVWKQISYSSKGKFPYKQIKHRRCVFTEGSQSRLYPFLSILQQTEHTRITYIDKRTKSHGKGALFSHIAALVNPWHTSGSSSWQWSRTCSGLSCTCERSRAPKGHQDLDQLTESRWRAIPWKW